MILLPMILFFVYEAIRVIMNIIAYNKEKAAEEADNNSLSPTFLIQAGEILESQGKNDEALKLYQTVKEKYFNSIQYQTIDAYIERVSNK